MSTKKPRVLGKGLTAVLEAVQISESVLSTDKDLREFKNISVQDIFPGKYQPRQNFDQNILLELSESIKQQGVIQPIVVRLCKNGYELIAGERRWRAAQMAGLQKIPAILCDIDDQAALAYGLIENLQRQNLSPLEEAEAFLRLQQDFNKTHEQIGALIGRSRESITNTLRLLSLSSYAKELLKHNKIEMGHARALLGLTPEQQDILANRVVEKGMTVREVEQSARTYKNPAINKTDGSKLNIFREKNAYWSTRLTNHLSFKVDVSLNKSGEGKIVIHIDSAAAMDRLFNKLSINQEIEDLA